MFEDYKSKSGLVVVFTGEGKGKTSAGLGLTARALGTGWRVAFIQFIKHWEVGEHQFLKDIGSVYGDNLVFIKGGQGFYEAGSLSAKGVTDKEHQQAALATYEEAYQAASSGKYQLVICDEINNAVHDKLITNSQMKKLIEDKHEDTNLCLTGRDFPKSLLQLVDIATNMTKIKHHFDDKYLANKGIDY
ncbi:MAG TPA: cob(I)yrinic acid a,c-diamide adenosyltransferase [Candidatus Saccharimonadales bacterium]|jgi:cob(I)alamin adenosyltransferase